MDKPFAQSAIDSHRRRQVGRSADEGRYLGRRSGPSRRPVPDALEGETDALRNGISAAAPQNRTLASIKFLRDICREGARISDALSLWYSVSTLAKGVLGTLFFCPLDLI
jgi:hypothetical protein